MINSYDPSSSVQPLCCYGEFFIVTSLLEQLKYHMVSRLPSACLVTLADWESLLESEEGESVP